MDTTTPRITEDKAHRKGSSTLVGRNIYIRARRTSLKLEAAMWEALGEICERERITLHELCARVDDARSESTLAASVRVFIMSYFRNAATSEGHTRAGHGRLDSDIAMFPQQFGSSALQDRDRGFDPKD